MSLDADGLTEVVAAVGRLQRRCVALDVIVAARAHRLAAAGHCAPAEEVLQDDGRSSRARARTEIARAEVAATFPSVGAAVADGSALPENLDTLARTIEKMTPAEIEALSSEHDAGLADAIGRLPQESFRRRVHRYRNKIRADHGCTAADQIRRDSFFRLSLTRDRNAHRTIGEIDPVRGAAIKACLDAEVRRLAKELSRPTGTPGAGEDVEPPSEALTADQLSAQAFHDLIVRGANTAPTFENTRVGVQVIVLADEATLANGPHEGSTLETADGAPIDPAEVSRLCCDATLRRLRNAEIDDVHVSRPTRTATAAQRAALLGMYRGCAISGAPWSECEVHHVTFHRHGGQTRLGNLIPVSRRWHHLIHDENWRLEMDAERTLRLYRPDGTLYRTIPRPDPATPDVPLDQDIATLVGVTAA